MPSPRQDFDQALKRLLVRGHAAFLALVAPGMVWQAALSPELPATPRQADLVWVVLSAAGQRLLLHIELQLRAEADMGERAAEYAIRLWRREHCPVLTLIIYLRPMNVPARSPFVMAWPGRETLRYSFDEMRLWETPREWVLDSPAVELWPLAGAMAGTTVETTLQVAERIAGAALPAQERDELLRVLVLLAGLRLPAQALGEALRRRPMIEDLWKESSLGQALRDLAEERAHERGKAEGLQLGVQEGKADGLRQATMVALAGHFGPLAADLLAALSTADQDTLLDLIAHVATTTLPRTRARLGLD